MNPLARLVVLLAPGLRAVGNGEPCSVLPWTLQCFVKYPVILELANMGTNCTPSSFFLINALQFVYVCLWSIMWKPLLYQIVQIICRFHYVWVMYIGVADESSKIYIFSESQDLSFSSIIHRLFVPLPLMEDVFDSLWPDVSIWYDCKSVHDFQV